MTLLVADCCREDGTVLKLRIANVSTTGFKAHCLEPTGLAKDEHIEVTIRKLAPFGATVVWSDGGTVGCKFDEPISVERIGQDFGQRSNQPQSPRAQMVNDWIARASGGE